MPMHPVTSTLMYRGICTIPDILSYSDPVTLPEDEVEGEPLGRPWLRVRERLLPWSSAPWTALMTRTQI